jgi:hypothetical protein
VAARSAGSVISGRSIRLSIGRPLRVCVRGRIGCGGFGVSPGPQVDCDYPHFVVVIDQQFGAPIELVGNIEQIFGEAIRCHARQQSAANSKVCFRALAFRDERTFRLPTINLPP